jgi:hypothetical protein
VAPHNHSVTIPTPLPPPDTPRLSDFSPERENSHGA